MTNLSLKIQGSGLKCLSKYAEHTALLRRAEDGKLSGDTFTNTKRFQNATVKV